MLGKDSAIKGHITTRNLPRCRQFITKYVSFIFDMSALKISKTFQLAKCTILELYLHFLLFSPKILPAHERRKENFQNNPKFTHIFPQI